MTRRDSQGNAQLNVYFWAWHLVRSAIWERELDRNQQSMCYSVIDFYTGLNNVYFEQKEQLFRFNEFSENTGSSSIPVFL